MALVLAAAAQVTQRLVSTRPCVSSVALHKRELDVDYAPREALGRLSQEDCQELIATESNPASLEGVLNLQWREEAPSNQTFVSSVGLSGLPVW